MQVGYDDLGDIHMMEPHHIHGFSNSQQKPLGNFGNGFHVGDTGGHAPSVNHMLNSHMVENGMGQPNKHTPHGFRNPHAIFHSEMKAPQMQYDDSTHPKSFAFDDRQGRQMFHDSPDILYNPIFASENPSLARQKKMVSNSSSIISDDQLDMLHDLLVQSGSKNLETDEIQMKQQPSHEIFPSQPHEFNKGSRDDVSFAHTQMTGDVNNCHAAWRILEKPCTESTFGEIVQALSILRNANISKPGESVTPRNGLIDAVLDKENRLDRFHKKKTHPMFSVQPLRFFADKGYATNSSGQGCTIVLKTEKCTRHARGQCIYAGPGNSCRLSIGQEPITRSNFGKWINAFLKTMKDDS